MRWIVPTLSVLAAALGAFHEPIQALIASHPAISALTIAVAGLLGSLAPQPHK